MIGIEIWRLEMDCWKCDVPNRVVYPNGLGGFGGGTWERVGNELGEKDYCNAQETHSRTQGRRVYGNICTECGAYQGNHFVHEAVFDTVAAFQSWSGPASSTRSST
jgi:hypothetical protein